MNVYHVNEMYDYQMNNPPRLEALHLSARGNAPGKMYPPVCALKGHNRMCLAFALTGRMGWGMTL